MLRDVRSLSYMPLCGESCTLTYWLNGSLNNVA